MLINEKIDSTFFHTLVDSFPTNQEYNENLDVGHYIKSFSLKNKQQFSIASIQDFDVFIFNNNTDLNIQIYDLNGEVITDADIQVSWKKLRYNKELKTYVDKRSNLKGIVKVTVNGNREVVNISVQPDAMTPDDTEQLEDLLLVAINRAMAMAAETEAAESQKLIQDMLPPGMGGLSDMFS